MKPLVVIPARGGSKGIPNKNIKLLNGKPLINYTVEAARSIFEDNKILVSTDDTNIKKIVEDTGLDVPYLRPSHLATDKAGTYEVLLHALDYSESTGYFPDTLILLQPTSPFRSSIHIQNAIEVYDRQKNIDMVVSVSETKSNPYFMLYEENKDGFLVHSKSGNFLRRQDCPKVWEYNGAIYIINVASLKITTLSEFERVKKYEMDEIDSVDLDTPLDWLLAEIIIKDIK